jgi:MFS superfamily sulfate permease-like transporter
VVALSIVAASTLGLSAHGVPTTGTIPARLPLLAGPALRISDVEGILPLVDVCCSPRLKASPRPAHSHQSTATSSIRGMNFSGLGAANLATAIGQGYPVAGGQSAVNDKAGARTPIALLVASVTLGLCLLFLTGLLENLPKAVLAAVVLSAISGLLDFRTLFRMWRVSGLDFYAAAIALLAVLLLGILQGILLAAFASIVMLLIRVSRPHVAFLGRVPGTRAYPMLPVTQKTNLFLALSPSAPRRRSSTSMLTGCWTQC